MRFPEKNRYDRERARPENEDVAHGFGSLGLMEIKT